MKALLDDIKHHYENMKNQSAHYQHRLASEITARKELETAQEQRVGDMRRAIEGKQLEI